MTHKIHLRALEPNDLEFLYEIENDTDLWHLSHTQQPFSKNLLQKYIAQADRDIYEVKQFRFGIELIDTKKIIGLIDLFDFDPKNKRAGVGIIIHKKYRQQGYGDASLKLLIEYAQNILFLHQLYANISSDNLTSIQLFKQNGFELIGNKKEWNFNGKFYIDEKMFQLIFNKKI